MLNILVHFMLETGNFALLLAIDFTGQRFALREGGRTVGAGVVSKVMS